MRVTFRAGIVNVFPAKYAVPLSIQPRKLYPLFVSEPAEATVKVSPKRRFGAVGVTPVPPFDE